MNELAEKITALTNELRSVPGFVSATIDAWDGTARVQMMKEEFTDSFKDYDFEDIKNCSPFFTKLTKNVGDVLFYALSEDKFND